MPSKVPNGCPLTWRQLRVMQLLADGLTPQQIAVKLDLANTTVRSRLTAAARRLGCCNTAHAISVVGRAGWLGWEPPEEATSLAVEHPFLAAYLQEFDRSRWPHEPDVRSTLGMRLALAGHRNTQT